jgi:hypothetical protein
MRITTTLILMLFYITSFSQNMIHYHVNDIVEHYANIDIKLLFTPNDDGVILIVKENKFGGSEMLYLNKDNYCYTHIYVYKGKSKMKEFKKMASRKGIRMSNEQIEYTAYETVKDSTHYSAEKKEWYKNIMVKELKKNRYYKINGSVKIKKDNYINTNSRLIWELYYDGEFSYIKIY